MLLEGIFPALTTPFHPDGEVYFRKLEQNLARYSLTSLAGFVVLGSTGEPVMLSDAESREVLRTARQACAPDKVLIAGVGRESVKETLLLAEFAATEQYDAVLVRTPNFYEPVMSQAAMLNYFRSVADRSPLPLILYSIPIFTHYNIPVAMVAELAAHPNILAIKDSSGSVERIRDIVSATSDMPKRTVTVTPTFTAVTARMVADSSEVLATFISAEQLSLGTSTIASAPPRVRPATRTREVGFQVLSGAPEQTLNSLQAGASGAVLAMGACAPQSCQEIYTAWKERNPEIAAAKQTRLSAASARVAGSLGIAGVKYACELNGYYGGAPRLPLLPLTAAQKAEIEHLMVDMRS